MSLKAAVITFPGSNCDDDCVDALARVCGYSVDNVWHKDTTNLSGYQLVVLPGGFSYGDYLRCGAIASLSPIMEKVREYAAGGGFVIGICNGFQMLCETGLLPGALARNEGLKFICKDVTTKVMTTQSPWTCDLKTGETLSLPIAHGDGRYVVSEAQYAELKSGDQILLTYSPNPNGSSYDIAGVCNATKNVFGLMPHPERAADLRSRDGLKILSSVTRTLREKQS
jgi:phosphoribosylformylglycinamidine synthase I